MLQIAFFGYHRAFGYNQLGGVESSVRRLATYLSKNNCAVHYVCYGASNTSRTIINDRLYLLYETTFDKAIECLKVGYDHVVYIYIHPIYRRQYTKFCRRMRGKTSFHCYLPGAPDSLAGWLSLYLMVMLRSINGRLFITSPSGYEILKRWFKRAVLILPPVPDDYFVSSRQKSFGKIRVTYIGRIDPEKGVTSIKSLFDELKKNSKCKMRFLGYTWSAKQAQREMVEIIWEDGKEKKRIFPFRGYGSDMNERLRNCLVDTDYLILPYKTLRRTMDPPLLVMEGMATLCAVITSPVGGVTALLGDSPFLINQNNFIAQAKKLVISPEFDLAAERRRIAERLTKLVFKESYIGHRFYRYLINDMD